MTESGNPGVIADWDDPTGRSYSNDNNNRLTSGGGSSFGYDWVGNRLNPPANPSPMVYDATDKLVRWPLEHQYAYLPTGSLQHQYDDDTPRNLEKTFAYTGAELLSTVTHAGVSYPSSMTWDADSNRVSFTTSEDGTTTEFVYDTTAGIPAVLEEWDGEASVYYIREPGGELIARMAGANKQYYHFDELGSTRFLTDDSRTVTDTYTYDAWGKQTGSTTPTAQPYRFVGRLGYYSHYQDENLFDDEYPTDPQFLQLGVRLYDPETGRFTQIDPVRDGMNWYAYVSGNPNRYADPDGRKQQCTRDIEVCSNGGHRWVCLDAGQHINCWGFHPTVSRSEAVTKDRVPGVVSIDNKYMWTDDGKKLKKGVTCTKMTISMNEWKNLRSVIDEDRAKSLDYYWQDSRVDLGDPDDPEYSCITWVDHILIDSGIKNP